MSKLEAFLLFFVYLPIQKLKQFWCGANLSHCWHNDKRSDRPKTTTVPDMSCNYINNVFEVINQKCCKCLKEKTKFKFIKAEGFGGDRE